MNKDIGLKTIVAGSFWVFVGMLLGYILEYTNRAIIGRFFGPSDYGIVSLSLSLSLIFASFSLLGFQTGLARLVAIYSEDKNELRGLITLGLKIVLLVSIIFSLILFLSRSFIVQKFFKRNSTISVISGFIWMIPLIAVGEYFYSCLRGLKLARLAVLSREVLRRIIVLIVLIGIIIFKVEGVYSISFAYFFGFATYMFSSGLFLIKKYSFLGGQQYLGGFRLRELMFFSLPLLFSFILKRFSGQIGNIFIGFFKDTREIGFFSAALPLSQVINFPLSAVLFMFLPVASNYWHKERYGDLRDIFKTVSKALF
ncbi:MAG TPA: hypothetical protein ENI51_05225, partial [Candidatus Atribacteria bacterium]|nr:hypothetical protein [Candidatus Atribacteria bacterium]